MQVAWTYNIKWTEGPCQHDARTRERKREGQRGMTESLKHHFTVPFPTKCSNEVWKARALTRGTYAPGGEGKVRILGHVRRTHFLISRWYIRLKAERNGDVISEMSSNMVPPPGTAYVGFLPTWPYLSLGDHTSPKVLLDPQDCYITPILASVVTSFSLCLYMAFSCSYHFSCSVMSNSLWPHGLQDTRLPCPSPTLGVCSDSCPSSRWRHPTISSSVVLFSSCLQSFPASGSFPIDTYYIELVNVSCSVMSDSLWPHGSWLLPGSSIHGIL